MSIDWVRLGKTVMLVKKKIVSSILYLKNNF